MKAGRELDARVAEKVMGLTVTWWGSPKFPDCKELGCGVPHYSTSIADAWQVVEKLAADGKHLALQAPGSTDMNECYRAFPKWTADFEFRLDSEAEADTAPLAICLAALKAMGVEVPND